MQQTFPHVGKSHSFVKVCFQVTLFRGAKSKRVAQDIPYNWCRSQVALRQQSIPGLKVISSGWIFS